MSRRARFWFAAVAGLVLGTAALAQPAPQPTDPAPRQDCVPGQDPSAPGESRKEGENLSDKLAESRGVICPPGNVDPDIAAPPPGGGRTPVIPPPAAPPEPRR